MKNKIDVSLILKNADKKDQDRTLGLFDLSILGIGAIIGTGILVLTGIVAATDSGPAVVFSFLIAALASGLIGLCYSELTTSIPNSGSAYVCVGLDRSAGGIYCRLDAFRGICDYYSHSGQWLDRIREVISPRIRG